MVGLFFVVNCAAFPFLKLLSVHQKCPNLRNCWVSPWTPDPTAGGFAPIAPHQGLHPLSPKSTKQNYRPDTATFRHIHRYLVLTDTSTATYGHIHHYFLAYLWLLKEIKPLLTPLPLLTSISTAN